jgi:hypothetical protein
MRPLRLIWQVLDCGPRPREKFSKTSSLGRRWRVQKLSNRHPACGAGAAAPPHQPIGSSVCHV